MGVLDASISPPKERYAVPKDNVIKLIQPGFFDDQLTEILRNGARALLTRAVEVDRDVATDPLSEGYLDRRLLRGAGGAARQGCCRVVGIIDRPPEGRLVRRARRVAEARSVGQALRLHLG